MNDKLKYLMDLIDVIKEVGEDHAAYCVWNDNGVLEAFFASDELNIDFEVGFKLPEEDPLYTTLNTGKIMYNTIPASVFGVGIEIKIIPVFDEDKVVGAFTTMFSSAKKDAITNHVNNFTDSLETTGNSIREIANGAENLSANMNNVGDIAMQVDKKLEEALEIVGDIKQNAKLSNILALNASIESARAGEAGRGFSVVSDEMRKFSKMSGEASEKINTTLSQIITALDKVKKSVIDSTQIAKEQASAVNGLDITFSELNKSFTELNSTFEREENF